MEWTQWSSVHVVSRRAARHGTSRGLSSSIGRVIGGGRSEAARRASFGGRVGGVCRACERFCKFPRCDVVDLQAVDPQRRPVM